MTFLIVKIIFLSSFLSSLVRAGNEEFKDQRKPSSFNKEIENENQEKGITTAEKYLWTKYDIDIIARSTGWSPEATKAHLNNQESFKSLVSELKNHEGYADAVMAENPGEKATIYFKNKVPEHVAASIRSFTSKNNLYMDVVTTRFSLKEHEARAENIVNILKEKEFLNVDYSLGPGDALEITASPPKKLRIPKTPQPESENINLNVIDETARKYLGREMGGDGLRGVRLSIISPGESAGVEDHTRGGRKIYSTTTGGQCTTGFTVMNSAGTTGVGTAGHCTGMNRYDAEPPEWDYISSWQAQHVGGWGDFEWHTTPHIEPAEYWASPSEAKPRKVESVDDNIVKNEWVCGYSRMQGHRKCDQVYRTSVSMSGRSRLVAMRNRNMTGGDSGGPWSWGTRAYGFHTGGKVIWFKWRDVWSRAYYLPVAITGVVVRTV